MHGQRRWPDDLVSGNRAISMSSVVLTPLACRGNRAISMSSVVLTPLTRNWQPQGDLLQPDSGYCEAR